MPHRSETIGADRWDRLFLTIVPEALRVFSNPPDSQHFGGPASRTTLSPPRSLMAREPSQTLPAKAENPFMLPGFRFLFAAIVLSTSMLIFGLGAAALLRAAHEEFASIPSRRAPPETPFAQRDDAGSTLAMLRAESSVVDEKAIEPLTADHMQDQPAIMSAPTEVEKPATEPDKVAALIDTATPTENSPSSEAAKPEAAAETPIQGEAPAQVDASSPGAETKIAAIAETAPTAPNEGAVTTPDHPSAPVEDSTRIAETRIATLGGPPVTIETQTPSKRAPAVIRKSAQAKRVVKRRRIAPAARVTQQAPQTPADPFARPLGR
jgi:hypothetical protein